MAESQTEADRRTEIEQAADELRENVPHGDVVEYETTGTLGLTIDFDAPGETDYDCILVHDFDAPEGYTFDALSLHTETQGAMVTFEPQGDR